MLFFWLVVSRINKDFNRRLKSLLIHRPISQLDYGVHFTKPLSLFNDGIYVDNSIFKVCEVGHLNKTAPSVAPHRKAGANGLAR